MITLCQGDIGIYQKDEESTRLKNRAIPRIKLQRANLYMTKKVNVIFQKKMKKQKKFPGKIWSTYGFNTMNEGNEKRGRDVSIQHYQSPKYLILFNNLTI